MKKFKKNKQFKEILMAAREKTTKNQFEDALEITTQLENLIKASDNALHHKELNDLKESIKKAKRKQTEETRPNAQKNRVPDATEQEAFTENDAQALATTITAVELNQSILAVFNTVQNFIEPMRPVLSWFFPTKQVKTTPIQKSVIASTTNLPEMSIELMKGHFAQINRGSVNISLKKPLKEQEVVTLNLLNASSKTAPLTLKNDPSSNVRLSPDEAIANISVIAAVDLALHPEEASKALTSMKPADFLIAGLRGSIEEGMTSVIVQLNDINGMQGTYVIDIKTVLQQLNNNSLQGLNPEYQNVLRSMLNSPESIDKITLLSTPSVTKVEKIDNRMVGNKQTEHRIVNSLLPAVVAHYTQEFVANHPSVPASMTNQVLDINDEAVITASEILAPSFTTGRLTQSYKDIADGKFANVTLRTAHGPSKSFTIGDLSKEKECERFLQQAALSQSMILNVARNEWQTVDLKKVLPLLIQADLAIRGPLALDEMYAQNPSSFNRSVIQSLREPITQALMNHSQQVSLDHIRALEFRAPGLARFRININDIQRNPELCLESLTRYFKGSQPTVTIVSRPPSKRQITSDEIDKTIFSSRVEELPTEGGSEIDTESPRANSSTTYQTPTGATIMQSIKDVATLLSIAYTVSSQMISSRLNMLNALNQSVDAIKIMEMTTHPITSTHALGEEELGIQNEKSNTNPALESGTQPITPTNQAKIETVNFAYPEIEKNASSSGRLWAFNTPQANYETNAEYVSFPNKEGESQAAPSIIISTPSEEMSTESIHTMTDDEMIEPTKTTLKQRIDEGEALLVTEKLVSALIGAMKELEKNNNRIDDPRIKTLIINLSNHKDTLLSAQTDTERKLSITHLEKLLEDAEKEFKNETGLWYFIQPILNGLATVLVSIYYSYTILTKRTSEAYESSIEDLTTKPAAQIIYGGSNTSIDTLKKEMAKLKQDQENTNPNSSPGPQKK